MEQIFSGKDLSLHGLLSPKRCRVSKLMHQRVPTEETKLSSPDFFGECKSPRSRIPGKIIKNQSVKSFLQENSMNVKFNPKHYS
jgi:hypothetical protein